MSLTPEIIALLTLDAIFCFFGLIAWVVAFRIAFHWNAKATTPLQYTLSKQSYLCAIIIKYIFMLKLPLFAFFIYTCDKLSSIIAGAMCAAGVVNSVDFGLYLTLFKLLNLYLFGFWLLLHYADVNDEKLPFTRLKFVLFLLFALPLFAEIALEVSFFSSLNISKIVSCCGTLFSAASDSYMSLLFVVDERIWVGLFYGSFGMILLAYGLKNRLLLIVSNTLFLIFAIISLIIFFSTYVYELPTHRCPFCLLQKDYYYVGYALYAFLFAGTFLGMGGGVLALLSRRTQPRFMRASLAFNTLYLLSISAYPLVYFLRNGVWL